MSFEFFAFFTFLIDGDVGIDSLEGAFFIAFLIDFESIDVGVKMKECRFVDGGFFHDGAGAFLGFLSMANF